MDADKRAALEAEFGGVDPNETVRNRGLEEVSSPSDLPSVGMGGLFALNQMIGQGGMGEVRRAMQVGLERDVAIKKTRTDRSDDAAHTSLLREARAMGHLEHPNIVPVHVIARDEEGNPFVAMKYIHGRTLADLIVPERGAEKIDAFVDALISVCHAVSYAHSRGILHLDIKPANIMLGEFGEVYLLDWGSAVNYRDGGLSGLPRIEEMKTVLGTPCYMAPELVTEDEKVGPEADVYLLGGVLYSGLCGRVPHKGATGTEVLMASYYGRIAPLGQDTDPGLRGICEKALARYASERFRSAEDLRQALVQWRESRAVNRILANARRQLTELKRLVSVDSAPADVYRVFGAARSGFEYVVGAIPESAAGREGLRASIEAMIHYELKKKAPGSAMRLYSELDPPSPDLLKLIEAGLEEQKALVRDAEGYHELKRDLDPTQANRQKAWVWVVIGLAIALPQLVPQALGHVPDARTMAGSHMVLMVVVAAAFWWFRDRLFTTRANRSLTMAIGVLIIFAMVVRMGAVFGLSSLAYALSLDLALVSVLSTYAIWNIDPRIRMVVPGYAVGAVLCAVYEPWATVIFPLVHLFNMLILAVYFALHARVK
ncbi:serine/threonine protein kinase [Microvenator marinus]|uniref:Serine/threonine protein kinase n=1 Tax=Microvenator marinus TaxID=2600177 RepID=A0A5B8XST0_9DELT|nr:serine/threonine-protein kinase [Microvenator marinus]QED28740.1 serine/threonine protein kinase [Microvenator marinus]